MPAWCPPPSTPAAQVGISFAGQRTVPAQNSTLNFSARYASGQKWKRELRYPAPGEGRRGILPFRTQAWHLRAHPSRGATRAARRDHRPGTCRCVLAAAMLNELGPLADGIRPVGPALLDGLGRIIYLGPVRPAGPPRLCYGAARMATHIGDDGGRAVGVLIASNCSPADCARCRSVRRWWCIFRGTERWLRELDVADGLQVRALGRRSARY